MHNVFLYYLSVCPVIDNNGLQRFFRVEMYVFEYIHHVEFESVELFNPVGICYKKYNMSLTKYDTKKDGGRESRLSFKS